MSKKIDLTGQRFGKLVVIEEAGRAKSRSVLWKCKCDCGNEVIIRGASLRSGHSKSCGCQYTYRKPENDLTGQRFGKLVVVERDGCDKWKHSLWKCKCDCGNETHVSGTSLKQGHTKSCGCYRTETNQLGLGEAGLNKVIRSYKRNAKTRGLEFKLSKEEVIRLTRENCFYCGAEPMNISRSSTTTSSIGDYIYNGIDRVDSSKGYVKGNVVPCCKQCNQAKLDYPEQEFLDWVKRVYEFNNLGGNDAK